MEAEIDDKLRDVNWIVDLIDESAQKPKKPGPKKGTTYRPRARQSAPRLMVAILLELVVISNLVGLQKPPFDYLVRITMASKIQQRRVF